MKIWTYLSVVVLEIQQLVWDILSTFSESCAVVLELGLEVHHCHHFRHLANIPIHSVRYCRLAIAPREILIPFWTRTLLLMFEFLEEPSAKLNTSPVINDRNESVKIFHAPGDAVQISRLKLKLWLDNWLDNISCARRLVEISRLKLELWLDNISCARRLLEISRLCGAAHQVGTLSKHFLCKFPPFLRKPWIVKRLFYHPCEKSAFHKSQKRKKYKQWQRNPFVPIPKRTLARLKKKARTDAAPISDVTFSDLSDESEDCNDLPILSSNTEKRLSKTIVWCMWKPTTLIHLYV